LKRACWASGANFGSRSRTMMLLWRTRLYRYSLEIPLMPIDVKTLNDASLQNIIDNHRRRGVIRESVYSEAIAEQARRRSKGLTFEVTMAVISQAARAGRFLSYGEVAEANGVQWNKVRHFIGRHLGDLIEYCVCKDLPLL